MHSSPQESDDPLVRELTLADVDSLRLGWWSQFDPAEVEAVLASAPGISTWIPESHEYALVGPWRHRADIMHLVELVSIRYPVVLTLAAVDRAVRAGVRLFLAVEMTERRQASFYERVGLSVLEEVLAYELIPPMVSHETFTGITPVVAGTSAVELLCEIDTDAFPWLWRNSPAEFSQYLGQPGVQVHLLVDDGEAIGYVGITAYLGWGHVDRIAVRANHQGRGFGRTLTRFAIARLASLGSSRIGLSTQRRNDRSQALYESLGFKRQGGSDYQIYGRALWSADTADELVVGSRR